MQHLVSRKWRDILVLQGPLPADAAMTKAFEASVKKFGARIVAKRDFKPGTDPREREQNNPLLLTALNRDYDVVFVADDAFDFARQAALPDRARAAGGRRDRSRAGRLALDLGAQRRARSSTRASSARRTAAAWRARTGPPGSRSRWWCRRRCAPRSADFAKQRDFILGGNGFDGYKGLAVSVRPWDQQLRQAVLLATPYAVVASAPVEGFLHRTNTLDTLGDDEPETPCKLQQVIS